MRVMCLEFVYCLLGTSIHFERQHEPLTRHVCQTLWVLTRTLWIEPLSDAIVLTSKSTLVSDNARRLPHVRLNFIACKIAGEAYSQSLGMCDKLRVVTG